MHLHLGSIALYLALISLSLLHPAHSQPYTLAFRDVSTQAGLRRRFGRRKKYGGGAIADLDGDGWPDLICPHHDDRTIDVYFNRRNGRFARNRWNLWTDTHGISPFRIHPSRKRMHFAVSTGGAFGSKLTHPLFYSVETGRRIVEATRQLTIYDAKGRGRNSAFLNLNTVNNETNGVPDAVFTNAVELEKWKTRRNYFAFRGGYPDGFHKPPGFTLEPLRGPDKPAYDYNWYATVADVDATEWGGQVELLTIHDLTVYRLEQPFTLRDVSSTVLPRGRDFSGTVAVAELDFDNDGKFDLFVARTRTGDLQWLSDDIGYRDYLLRNVGGRYVDVSWRAGIPNYQDTRGCTVGDFNNDGWVDIYITRWIGDDVLLLNNRNGTFRPMRGLSVGREASVRGDMAHAVDYDRDGRLDIILSEGHTHDASHGGFYRIMKNIMKKPNPRYGFLLVRVGSSPTMRATSLHAVVTVHAFGVEKMVRRVGSPGTAVSTSYIEEVHFGIGGRVKVLQVTVRWMDGTIESKYDVAAGAKLTFGRV